MLVPYLHLRSNNGETTVQLESKTRLVMNKSTDVRDRNEQ